MGFFETVGKPGKLHEAETRQQSIISNVCYRLINVDSACFPPPFQEYIFRLEPGKVDSGKGKCPFDPKLNSVSALISKDLSQYLTTNFFFIIIIQACIYRALYSYTVALLTQMSTLIHPFPVGCS